MAIVDSLSSDPEQCGSDDERDQSRVKPSRLDCNDVVAQHGGSGIGGGSCSLINDGGERAGP